MSFHIPPSWKLCFFAIIIHKPEKIVEIFSNQKAEALGASAFCVIGKQGIS